MLTKEIEQSSFQQSFFVKTIVIVSLSSVLHKLLYIFSTRWHKERRFDNGLGRRGSNSTLFLLMLLCF